MLCRVLGTRDDVRMTGQERERNVRLHSTDHGVTVTTLSPLLDREGRHMRRGGSLQGVLERGVHEHWAQHVIVPLSCGWEVLRRAVEDEVVLVIQATHSPLRVLEVVR